MHKRKHKAVNPTDKTAMYYLASQKKITKNSFQPGKLVDFSPEITASTALTTSINPISKQTTYISHTDLSSDNNYILISDSEKDMEPSNTTTPSIITQPKNNTSTITSQISQQDISIPPTTSSMPHEKIIEQLICPPEDIKINQNHISNPMVGNSYSDSNNID